MIKPAPRHLLIQPAPIPEMNGLLHIPPEFKNEPNYATVIKSGAGCRCFGGDRVMFLQGAVELLPDGTAIVPERFCYLMFNGLNPDPKNMLLHDGWVLIKVPYLEMAGNTPIEVGKLQSTASKVSVTCRRGTVVATTRNAYNRHDHVISSYLDKDNRMDVKKGDRVFFSSYVVNSIRNGVYMFQSDFVWNDEQYIIIPYKELICKFDNGFTGLNRNIIALRTEKEKSSLVLPDGFGDEPTPEYVVESDGYGHLRGEKIIVNPADKLVTLEPELDRVFDKEFWVIKDHKSLATVHGEKIIFNKKKTISI